MPNVDLLRWDTSSRDPHSIALLNAALHAYLNARESVGTIMAELLQHEPDMSLAHCLQGYLLKLAAHPQHRQALATHIKGSAATADTPYETLHAQALAAWAADDVSAAVQLLQAICQAYPHDMLALRILHYILFYRGAAEHMCASTGSALTLWPRDHPYYGYLLGMHAFGLEEAGQYAQAEAAGRTAVTHNPTDLWAIHAVDHVLYMQHQHEAGLSWLEQHAASQQGANNFRHHLCWHQALHWLHLQAPERALNLYDQHLAASIADDFYLDLCNNVALLWRIEQSGIDVGERWQTLQDTARDHCDDRELVFASLHYGIALFRSGDPAAQRFLANMQAWSRTQGEQSAVCRNTGLDLAQALQQHMEGGDPWHIHDGDIVDIGGSRAQREIFLGPMAGAL